MIKRLIVLLVLVSLMSTLGAATVSAAPQKPTALTTPVLSTPTDGQTIPAGNGIHFSWSPVAGATSYTIEFLKDGKIVQTKRTADTSWNAYSTETGTFQWHVMATHGKVSSPWSDTFTLVIS